MVPSRIRGDTIGEVGLGVYRPVAEEEIAPIRARIGHRHLLSNNPFIEERGDGASYDPAVTIIEFNETLGADNLAHVSASEAQGEIYNQMRELRRRQTANVVGPLVIGRSKRFQSVGFELERAQLAHERLDISRILRNLAGLKEDESTGIMGNWTPHVTLFKVDVRQSHVKPDQLVEIIGNVLPESLTLRNAKFYIRDTISTDY